MKKNKLHSSLLACMTVILSCVAYVACDDDSSAIKEPPGNNPRTDSGPPGTDGGSDADTLPDGAPKDCFENPQTHFEIINACTNATRISKNPTLKKLLPDGGLPPLN